MKSKDPTLVFLAETKASANRIKGIQRKTEFTQGIIVPNDGRSGGLALLWREGIDVRFKSCSNSHIDVVVHGVVSIKPWPAISFYSQPEASKRGMSWQLLEALHAQCNMPWAVFEDFNKILHSGEKLGGADSEAK